MAATLLVDTPPVPAPLAPLPPRSKDAHAAIRNFLAATPDVLDRVVPQKMIGSSEESAVYRCLIGGLDELVAVKVERDLTAADDDDGDDDDDDDDDDPINPAVAGDDVDDDRISRAVGGLGPSFPRFYGTFRATGSEFLLGQTSADDEKEFLKRIAPLPYPPLRGGAVAVEHRIVAVPLKFSVMEYIPQTYADFIDSLPPDEKKGAEDVILIQVAGALAGAQDALGLEHNDLHTGNILIRADGTPVLIDLAYARITKAPAFVVTHEPGVCCVAAEDKSPMADATIWNKGAECKIDRLMGSMLRRANAKGRESYGLPRNVLGDPLRQWYDIAYLCRFISNNGRDHPWPRFRPFFEAHGTRFNVDNARPTHVARPFTPRDFCAFASDPKAYLHALSATVSA